MSIKALFYSRNKNIFAVLVFGIVVVFLIAFGIYSYYIGPVSKDSGIKEIEVPSGYSYLTIDTLLKENNLIKSNLFYKVYIKLNNPKPLEACTYHLSENMSVKEIIEVLSKGCNVNPNVIRITFKEGLNMRQIAKIIAENTNNRADSVFTLLEDKNYIDSLIEKYWFLTSEIKNEQIYYPLEGYLFPNTYEFHSKEVTVAEIFEIMLDEMGKQLEIYKEDIEKTNFTIHELLTLASIVELEGASSDDRALVAGVFYNRLRDKWTLGSDITGYYGAKMDDWSKGLGKHIDDCNGYNTRGTCVSGLPVGPVSNPSLESIEATLNPKQHDYYYFVADCSGKTYLNYDEKGHSQTINKLKRENNWCDN